MTQTQRNNIISKSWDLILNDYNVKKIFFFPGLISIVFLTIILIYQSLYTYVVLFNQKETVLTVLLGIFHSSYFLELVIFLLVCFLLYLFFIPIFDGSLIWYLHKKSDETSASFMDCLGNGIYNFLPLFEYSNIFSQFKFITILNAYLFCLRFIGIGYILRLTYALVFMLFISFFVNILFVYSKYEIVLNNKKAIESISTSVKIATLNLGLTIKLYFFMVIVNIRVVLNFLVFLLFPLLIISLLTYVTSKVFLVFSIFLIGIIFFVSILILGYLGGVFDVFRTAIWYYAYLEGKTKLEEKKDE